MGKARGKCTKLLQINTPPPIKQIKQNKQPKQSSKYSMLKEQVNAGETKYYLYQTTMIARMLVQFEGKTIILSMYINLEVS